MKMLSEETTLFRLPVALDARQKVPLEAIGYVIQAIGIADDRLHDNLLETSLDMNSKRFAARSVQAEAFSAAWSIIDNMHRLRRILSQTSVVPNETPKKLLLRQTESVTDLRHAVQHADEKINTAINEGLPPPTILGDLYWIFSNQPEWAVSCVMASGSFGTTTRSMEPFNPAGLSMITPIDNIKLVAFGQEIYLSKVVRDVRNFTEVLEKTIAEGIARLRDEERAHGPADLTIGLLFQLHEKGVESDRTALNVKGQKVKFGEEFTFAEQATLISDNESVDE